LCFNSNINTQKYNTQNIQLLTYFSSVGFGRVAFRFFSVSLKVLSHGNLRRRSLQGPRSARTGWLTNTTFSSGFLFVYLWQFTFGLHVEIL